MDEKMMQELLDQIKALQAKVEELSQKVEGKTAEDTEGKDKVCRPGFNSCSFE